MASYFQAAAAVLPGDHGWIVQATAAREEVLSSLRDRATWGDHGFRVRADRRLRDLKREYIAEYLRLHTRARLGANQDERKKRLLGDGRLAKLEQLAAIELLPGEQLADLRERLGKLESCFAPSKRDMEAGPDCPRCRFHPSEQGAAAPVDEQLSAIDRDLDRVLAEWTAALVENLNDPTTTGQMELTRARERQLIQAFLASRTLPEPLNDEFVKALREVLSGLSRVVLTADGIRAALAAGGLPATLGQIGQRFEGHLAEVAKGLDPAKVRIVLGARE